MQSRLGQEMKILSSLDYKKTNINTQIGQDTDINTLRKKRTRSKELIFTRNFRKTVINTPHGN